MADEMNMEELGEYEDADMMSDFQTASLFWSLKVPADSDEITEITQPALSGYHIHITKACFGPSVKNGSRTVVMCGTEQEDDETEDLTWAPVCVLQGGKVENCNLDLVFGEAAAFKLEGTKTSDVWLTGHLQPGYDSTIGGMEDEEEMYRRMAERGDIMDMNEDEDEEDMDEQGLDEDNKQTELRSASLDEDIVDESEEVASAPAHKKRKQNNGQAVVSVAAATKSNKKSPNNQAVAAPTTTSENNNEKNEKNKKQQNKSPKQSPKQTPKESPKQEAAKSNKNKKNKKKKKMSGGIEYKDLREGSGNAIKKGDKVWVYYIGQLDADQSIFDKTLNGDGFSFTVGGGEVIKGWDLGLIGMKGEGSKRKLWIPPNMAYGKQAQDGIPANSKLLFTIEVRKVE